MNNLMNMKMLLATTFLLTSVLYTQSNYDLAPDLGGTKIIETEPGHNYILTQDQAGVSKVHDIDLGEELNIIVEFKEKPLFLKQKFGEIASKAEYINQFSSFEESLQALHQKSVTNSLQKIKPPEVKKKFYKLFNGVSLTAARAIINDINKLDYVKGIHLNRKIEAHLDTSVSIIKADSVWKKFNTRGDSILVAVIDSGIDYLHPALGGGIGEEFKVIGGYDFVNEDNDPMDDLGHGTHVAVIVAAEGDSIQGVAPAASLLALKVLNSFGWGTEDNIISAIEYCADPNGDGDFSDKVDIANLSLGSPGGSPNDPSAIAVNNASSIGVIFCISSGNSRSFNIISSPGTAVSAITVGASNDDDQLANFSSKGPSKGNFYIKPELVAPGVNINSLEANGTYREASGTSMSSPHVAGACALLKSLHPEWGPEEMKSALMTTSVDLGFEVMAQGAGRIDVLEAAQVSSILYPAHLSFGLDNAEESNWTVFDTIIVSNISDSVQSYQFEYSSNNSAIVLDIVPGAFILEAGEEISIIAKLSVDNNSLAYPTEGSLSYGGRIQISTGEKQLFIPWAFVKAAKLIITSDTPSIDIGIVGPDFIADNWFNYFDEEWEFILPKNIYDIFAFSSELDTTKFFLQEEIEVDGFKKIHLNFSELNNHIVLNGKDESGRMLSQLPNYLNSLKIDFPDHLKLGSLSLLRSNTVLQMSDVSDRYKIGIAEFQSSLELENSLRVLQYETLFGINSSINLVNNSRDYIGRDVQMIINRDNSIVSSVFVDFLHFGFYPLFFGWITESINLTEPTWTGKVFINKDVDPFIRYSSNFLGRLSDPYSNEFIYGTTPISAWNNQVHPFLSEEPTAQVFLSTYDEPIRFGVNPFYLKTLYFHEPKFVEGANLVIIPNIAGSREEVRYDLYNKSIITIYNSNGENIETDSLINMPIFNLPKSQYIMEIQNDSYSLKGIRGQFRLTSHFDLGANDRTPPTLTSFRLLNGSRETVDHFNNSDSILAFISLADFEIIQGDSINTQKYNSINTSKTRLLVRINEGEKWKESQGVVISEDSEIGILYKFKLSDYATLDSASIDIKLLFEDLSGNKSEWEISPAFTVGKMPIITDNVETVDLKDEPVFKYSLENNYPNPFNPSTTIKYSIPVSSRQYTVGSLPTGQTGRKHQSFNQPITQSSSNLVSVQLKVYDVLGREVAVLVNERKAPGNYSVEFDGSDLTSGVYFYTLNAGEFRTTKKMVLAK